jgi:hypothetical protein
MNKKVIVVRSEVIGIKRGGWKGGVAERGGGWLSLARLRTPQEVLERWA